MARQLLLWSENTPQYAAFDLPSGLAPAKAARDNPTASPVAIKVNAAKNKMFVATSGSSNQAVIFSGPTLSTPLPMAAGTTYQTLNCCTFNDDFAVVGGATAPYLSVFNAQTGEAIALDTTGLAAVTSVTLSLDGAWLAVNFSTAPYMRVYKTADWTYRNYSENGSSNAVQFFAESGHLLLHINGYFITYQVSSSVYSEVRRYAGGYICNDFLHHPSDPAITIVLSDQSRGIFTYNASTGEMVTYANSAYTFVSGCIVGRKLYANHAEKNGRTVTIFDIDAKAPSADQYSDLTPSFAGSSFRVAGYSIGAHKVTGTVRDISNSVAARTIRAFQRSSGRLMAQAISSAATGDYVLEVFSSDELDMQFMANDSELLNDLFFARVTPEPV